MNSIVAQSSDSTKTRITEQQAKKAVHLIVQYSGLTPNFVVRENEKIKTAIAYIKGGKRYIEYNPTIILRVIDESQTDWSAISILAHEIAHHLLGHTLDPTQIGPGDELACDMYSGFILAKMGAAMEEAIIAMELIGSQEGTRTHPPKSARIDAIKAGFTKATNLEHLEKLSITTNEAFRYQISFERDENLYYVNKDNELVWYDPYAQPIVFGNFFESESNSYQYEFTYNNERFYIDSKGNIWNLTSYNAFMIIGELKSN